MTSVLPGQIYSPIIKVIYSILKVNKKRLLKEIIFILFIAILFGLTYNSFSEQKISLIYKPFVLKDNSNLTIKDIRIIHKQKDALFIDTRDKDEYEAGHIPDAVNIPAGMARSKKMEILNQLPKDIQIITYCANPNCHIAERLAGEIQFLKFKSVTVFKGGWEAWQSTTTHPAKEGRNVR